MEEDKLYKYIIINKEHTEVILINSYREISEFINTLYSDKKISHTTIGERLKDKKFFHYNDLLVKELIWK